jgi:hypothetical protein
VNCGFVYGGSDGTTLATDGELPGAGGGSACAMSVGGISAGSDDTAVAPLTDGELVPIVECGCSITRAGGSSA